jgi:hypothetical protein
MAKIELIENLTSVCNSIEKIELVESLNKGEKLLCATFTGGVEYLQIIKMPLDLHETGIALVKFGEFLISKNDPDNFANMSFNDYKKIMSEKS